MQLACDDVVAGLSCEYIAKGDTVVAVQQEMMKHADEAHTSLFDGASPQEIALMRDEMEGRVFDLLRIR